ncbi:nuclear transport factor 2 family protein [Streptomyces sp. NPDC057702]|uniref:nuclear transport factor 2 family protein n=1 Tax=unclassified Streptomyces TaxID=2593676 RepID=UPI0036952095
MTQPSTTHSTPTTATNPTTDATPLTPAGPAATDSAALTERTRAVIEEYLRRVADPGQGPAEIAAVYAEVVDWQIAPNPVVPWIRPRSTREDVAGHWIELARYTVAEEGGAQIDAFLVDGADAVLTGHLHGTVRATGKTFQSPFALRLTVVNDEIVRHHIYEDALAIAAACTPDGAGAAA